MLAHHRGSQRKEARGSVHHRLRARVGAHGTRYEVRTLSWARVAALLMRMSQSLLPPHRLRASCDVVDPLLAIRATLELMEVPLEKLGGARGGYNVSGCSFTAGELVTSIRRHMSEFTCTFEPDIRQKYADSWPNDIEDDVARDEWGWVPEFDLDGMVDAMFAGLKG